MGICICISVLACCLSSARSQDLLRGRVLDSADRSAVSYVSIGIEGKNVGTMSDAEGNFVLPVTDAAGNADTLLFSCVGYASRKIPVSEIDFSREFSFALKRNDSPIPETVVRTSRSRRMKIGRSKIGTDLLSAATVCFSSPEPLGEECGMLLSSRYDCTVNRLSFFVRKNGFESASFRLTFYSAENGLPKDILGDKDIRFDLPDGYTGWVDLDLSECPVHVKAGDFAVTMTFLDGKQGESAFRGLEFPITVAPLSKYTLVSRDRALGAWSKEGTVITLFTEVTAYPD